jgi:hypothetical protein
MKKIFRSTLLLTIFLLLQSGVLGQPASVEKSNRYVPEVKLTAPVGGEKWVIGKQQNITWTSAAVTSVKLEYSIDNGTNWVELVATTPASAKSYPWTIPNLPTDSCLVRISDVAGQATAVTSSLFSIVRPSLSITSPVGSENWVIASTQNITWTSNGLDTVRIEYSLDNGTTWSTIVDKVSATLGTYAWTLPSTTSTTALVNIADINGIAIPSTSKAFTISKPVPTLSLTAPAGGEKYIIGKSVNITWTSTNITSVKLEYSIDNGTNWVELVASTPASAESYPWTIPNLPTDNCLVRISDVAGQATAVTSSLFSIVRPSLSITAPVGGENWVISSTHNITWTSNGLDTVRIEYSLDNGTTWSTVVDKVSATLGTHAWILPATASTTALVNIADINGIAIPSTSKAFTISKPIPTLTLTAPAGGEKYTVGNSVNVTWTSTNITTVKLEYSSDSASTWTSIGYVAASAGTYAWTIPNAVSAKCFVKVSDSTDATVASVNASVFAIEALQLTIAQIRALPATSTAGTKVTVRGIVNSPNFHATKNAFYMQDGTAGINIYGGTSYGPTPGDSVVVVGWLMLYNGTLEVSDTTGTTITVTKVSSGVAPTPKVVTVAELNANGENYESQLITVNSVTRVSVAWPASTGSTTTVKCTANGVTTDTLLLVVKKPSEVLSSGSEPVWPKHVTGIATQYTTTGTGGYQIMPRYVADFVTPIVPKVTVTAPAAGNSWTVATSQNITWTSTLVSTVKLEYSIDSAATWNTIIANTPASAGTYAWIVPSTPSKKCFVKISDSTGTATASVSGLFSINATPIASMRVNNANGSPVDSGKTFTISGWVTSASQIGKNAAIQDNTAGMTVYDSLFAYGTSIGDSVVVTATLTNYRGLAEMTGVTFSKTGVNSVQEPTVITCAQMTGQAWSGLEAYESKLVKIKNVTITGTGTYTSQSSGYTITDSSGTATLYINKAVTGIIGQTIPTALVNITGIVSQYKSAMPYSTGYQLLPRQISDIEGTVGVSSDNAKTSTVKGFALAQNYPNPFNPTTTINYSLDKAGMVTLKIYSILGTEVASLVNEFKSAGNYSVPFNASNLTSGVYIYKLQAGNQSITKKLTLMK